MSFYRPEVFQNKKSNLWGEVLVAPTRFYLRAMGALFLSAFIGFTLIVTSHYSLKETVSGVIEPEKGMVSLFAPVTGYVSDLESNQGQIVSQEQILLKISDHPKTHSGENFDESFKGLLQEDYKTLEKKLKLLEENKLIKLHEIQLEEKNTQDSLKIYESQRVLSKATFENLEARLKDLQNAYDSGAISSLQMKNFEAESRAKEQELLSLDEKVLLARSRLEQLALKKRDIAQATDEQQVLLAQQKTDVQKKLIEFDRHEGVSIYAPSSMKLTQLNVQSGQYVQSGTHLLNLEHQDDIYTAVLQIPESSVGLVEKGMVVNLRIHAFPYEHYGILTGKISHISESSVFEPNSGQYYYKAYVSLDQQVMYGNGRSYNLRQGLVLEADIKTQKITLIDKIFEPLKRFKRM